MANNQTDGPSDDFLEQILGFPAYAGAGAGNDPNLASGNDASSLPPPMMLQLSSGDGSSHLGSIGVGVGVGVGAGLGVGSGGAFHRGGFPLGLSLEQGKGGGFVKMDEASASGKRFRDDVVDVRPASSSVRPVRCCNFLSLFRYLVKWNSEKAKIKIK